MEAPKDQQNIKNVENSVEKLKAMQFMGNIHKLTPKIETGQGNEGVAIIDALKSDLLIEETVLDLKGYTYDPIEKKYIQYRSPVMNTLGIGNFKSSISIISKTIEFSSFDKDQIPGIALYLFKMNWPYFTIYHTDYDLDKKDFNLVADALFSFIISSLHKAKGAGHRNVIRGTYSEGLLGRFSKDDPIKKDNRLGGLAKFNPFKKSKGV